MYESTLPWPSDWENEPELSIKSDGKSEVAESNSGSSSSSQSTAWSHDSTQKPVDSEEEKADEGKEEEEEEERDDDDDNDGEYLTGFKLLAIMVSVTVASYLVLLDVAIVSTAVPRITSTFHSLDDVGWYGTAYIICNCALLPLSGKMYALFSNKWTFIGYFGLFEVGSAICGAAQSSKMLIIGRAVTGLGAAGVLNGAFTIIYASVLPKRQPALLGMLMGFAQLGMVSGPLIGGALTEHASWRWCFYLNLPCGAIVGGALLLVPLPDNASDESERRPFLESIRQLDWIGFFVFAGSALQLLLALNWGGQTYAWNSATIIGLFCGSGATFLVFLAWAFRQGDEAMIPLSAMRRTIVLYSCLNYAFLAGNMLITIYYLPIYFQSVRGASPTSSGVDMLPLIITNIIFAAATGALVGRVGYYMPFGVAAGVFTTIGTGLMTLFKPNNSTGTWIGYEIVQGVGRGLGFQIPIVAMQNNWVHHKSEVPVLTGLVVSAQQLGGAIFLSLADVIFQSSLRSALAVDAPNVDAETVIAAGATGVREAVNSTDLPGVLEAYSHGFDRVMFLATGAASATFAFAFGMGWVNINHKDPAKKSGDVEDVSSTEEAAVKISIPEG